MPDCLDIKDISCAFTGHRQMGENFNPTLFKQTVEQFILQGIKYFYCGMAMGFDLIAADVVLELKEKYPHVVLIACVPCPDQEKNFPTEEKEKYKRILPLCDKVARLSESYYRGCMLARDRFMVDNCHRVLAYLDRQDGGTAYTVRYAKSKKRDIYIM